MQCTTKYCSVKGNYMRIQVPKELDHNAADEVRLEAECIFTKCPIQNVIFDFQNTTFMDSSGIGLITGRYRKICDLGGKIYVYGLSGSMDKLFLLSGLNTIVNKIADMEDVPYEE